LKLLVAFMFWVLFYVVPKLGLAVDVQLVEAAGA
jgi:hypothetical protein